jgi:hypothetical protein
MSKKSSIRIKLEERYNIFFTRKELYKALCGYNDSMSRFYDLDELERLLDGNNEALERFSNYLLEQFEPEAKFVA